MLRSAGVTWAARHAWHFEGSDVSVGDFVEVSHSHDLKAFVSVTGDWSRGYETEYQDQFVAALARLAANGADAIEIWDEPNILSSMPAIDPVRYSDLLCLSFEAIKSANPRTLVVSGPPSPTRSSGTCTASACGDAEWLEALAAAGAFACADFVGARYTTGATSPSAAAGHPTGLSHHSFYLESMVRRYYEAAGSNKPLAFSELGYLAPEGYIALPDTFWWAAGTTSAQQATWTGEAVRMAAESSMVGMVMIWNLDAIDWGGEYESVRAGYALIRPDGTCPACDVLQRAYIDS